MNRIKYSILMSVYYKEKVSNLQECMDSLLNQTYLPDEIVIVEDGPLYEELEECIRKYAKNKIVKVYPRKENSGLGIALNYGLTKCQNEYVARMDTDDIAEPNRFELQFRYIATHEVDVLGGNIIEFDDTTGKLLNHKSVPLTYEKVKKYIKKRNPINHMTVIFKKSKVEEVGGYLDCPYFEDYYLWARLIANGCKIENINDVVVKARAGYELTKRRGSASYVKNILNIEKKLLDLKIINHVEYFQNVIIRTIIALLPNHFRYAVYQKILRKKATA